MSIPVLAIENGVRSVSESHRLSVDRLGVDRLGDQISLLGFRVMYPFNAVGDIPLVL